MIKLKHNTKLLISLVIIIMLMCGTWYGGSHLIVAHQAWLQAPERRLYIITLLLLGWVLRFTLFDNNSAAYATPETAETFKKIQLLRGRFKGVMEFLKKTIIHKEGKKISLAELPWFLLIGAAHSGKTTLLTRSTIKFILSKQIKPGTAATESCDWWVTRDLVLVDVPGSYLVSKEKKASHFLWKHFLNLVKNSSKKNPLRGIIVTLNLPELMQKKNNLLSYDLKNRIIELREEFGPALPFYFVVTKCDFIPGFSEFFNEATGNELTQSWGFTLPAISNTKLIDVFTNRFNVLIKQLNKQLIWRLHQERNSEIRSYIKDFPLHVERLKEALIILIKALMLPDFVLQGVYLTSSLQEKSETHPNELISPLFTHSMLELLSTPVLPPRAYFIKQVILQILPAAPANPVLPVEKKWPRRVIYAVSLSTILTAVVLMGRGFQHSVQLAYSIKNELVQYQLAVQKSTQQSDRLIKALPLLNALQQAANFSERPLSSVSKLFSFYSNKAQQTTNQVYAQALQTIVIPQIKIYFENYLENTANKNPEDIYAILKGYLMLGDSQLFNTDLIAKNLQQLMPPETQKEILQALAGHLNAAVHLSSKPIELNMPLLTQTRQFLISLPSSTLSMIILKNQNILQNNPKKIPYLYTAPALQKMLASEINLAAKESLQGNETIGREFFPPADEEAIHSIASQLRTQYLENYISFWENALASLQMTSPQTIAQADAMITALMDTHSSLWQQLQLIQQNTAFQPILAASPKLQALNIGLKDSLYQAASHLGQLHVYLQTLLTAADPGKTFFSAAVQRMQYPDQGPLTQIRLIAEQNPDPMRTWLTVLVSQSWHCILQEAANYIEKNWHAEIIPIYHKQIADRYPFNALSKQAVELPQLISFLGYPGVFSNFYHTFLSPFIKDTDKNWAWRTVDNQKIPFSNSTLAQLQQSIETQRILFPQGDTKLSLEFNLQPFSLNAYINAQKIGYHKKIQNLRLPLPEQLG